MQQYYSFVHRGFENPLSVDSTKNPVILTAVPDRTLRWHMYDFPTSEFEFRNIVTVRTAPNLPPEIDDPHQSALDVDCRQNPRNGFRKKGSQPSSQSHRVGVRIRVQVSLGYAQSYEM